MKIQLHSGSIDKVAGIYGLPKGQMRNRHQSISLTQNGKHATKSTMFDQRSQSEVSKYQANVPQKQRMVSVLPVVTPYNIKVNDSILKGQSRSSLGAYTNKSFKTGVTRNKLHLSASNNNRSLTKNASQSGFEFQPHSSQFRQNKNILAAENTQGSDNELSPAKVQTETSLKSSNFPTVDASTVSGR